MLDDEKIIVSRQDAEIFVNAILNTVEPNEYLKAAAESYKSLLRE